MMKPRFLSLIGALLALIAMQAMFVSCSSGDEPETGNLVGYYLALDSSEIIGLSDEDELNGSMRPPQEHNAYMTYVKMRRALKRVFPKPLPQGDDARAIAACDSCYKESIFYYQREGDLICSVKLMRASMKDDRVVGSRQLKYYSFNRYPVVFY